MAVFCFSSYGYWHACRTREVTGTALLYKIATVADIPEKEYVRLWAMDGVVHPSLRLLDSKGPPLNLNAAPGSCYSVGAATASEQQHTNTRTTPPPAIANHC